MFNTEQCTVAPLRGLDVTIECHTDMVYLLVNSSSAGFSPAVSPTSRGYVRTRNLFRWGGVGNNSRPHNAVGCNFHARRGCVSGQKRLWMLLLLHSGATEASDQRRWVGCIFVFFVEVLGRVTIFCGGRAFEFQVNHPPAMVRFVVLYDAGYFRGYLCWARRFWCYLRVDAVSMWGRAFLETRSWTN